MGRFLFVILFLSVSVVVYSQPFRAVVASDGSGTHTSVQAAINDCPDGERSLIFIKNGTYNEQISIGSKDTASKQIISLIGESANDVIITSNGDRGENNSDKTIYDIVTAQIYASDFYAENITIANTAGKDKSVGQAEALYTASDRQTFKNCRLLGHQDTYKSNDGVRFYFKDCFIEGTVDFIYGGGVVFFDSCTINSVRDGGYITAPAEGLTIKRTETAIGTFLRYGLIFRNCNLTANEGVAEGSYYLGRPWKTTAGAYYFNCRMGKHINSKGWMEWDGNESTASFCEYNSMDADGNLLDVSGRVSWSLQLPQADVDALFQPESLYKRAKPAVVYDPSTVCAAPSAPSVVNINGKTVSWSAVDGVVGYIILNNGRFESATSNLSYTCSGTGAYSVKSVSTTGALSEAKSAVAAVKSQIERKTSIYVSNGKLNLLENASVEIFSIVGQKVYASGSFTKVKNIQGLQHGIYIVKGKTQQGKTFAQRVVVK